MNQEDRFTCLTCSEARERMHEAEDRLATSVKAMQFELDAGREALSEIASIADNHPEWPAMRQIFDICSGLLPA